MKYQRILVFAAHPDDEITMAGTMARAAAEGVRVAVVQMTDGSEGYPSPDMRAQIVELRRAEAEECNRVLGIARRVFLDRPDMGLVNDKETLKECIRVIREERPEAIFTHGPADNHRDHLATHALAVEARWHAGEPVAAELGESWKTPTLFYYKSVRDPYPTIRWDVSATAHKRQEALAAQVSQQTLFGRTREQFLAEARRIQEAGGRHYETFWLAPANTWEEFPG